MQDSTTQMAEFGLIVNVIELASTAIQIVQHIRQTREIIKNLPKVLEQNTQLLDELLDTLQLVRSTEALQTISVADQVKSVAEKAKDVENHLTHSNGVYQRRKTAKGYIHVFLSGTSDEKELSTRLHRLSSARDELVLRIQIVGVELTKGVHEGVQTMTSTVQELRNDHAMIRCQELAVSALPLGNPEIVDQGTSRENGTPDPTDNTTRHTGQINGHEYRGTRVTDFVSIQQGNQISTGGDDVAGKIFLMNRYENNVFGGHARVMQGDRIGGPDFFAN